jgi:hypothetical protein
MPNIYCRESRKPIYSMCIASDVHYFIFEINLIFPVDEDSQGWGA